MAVDSPSTMWVPDIELGHPSGSVPPSHSQGVCLTHCLTLRGDSSLWFPGRVTLGECLAWS